MSSGCPEEDNGQLSPGPALDLRGPGPCHVICLSKPRMTGVCVLLKGRDDSSKQTVSRPWEGPEVALRPAPHLWVPLDQYLYEDPHKGCHRSGALRLFMIYFNILNTRKCYKIQLDILKGMQLLHSLLP